MTTNCIHLQVVGSSVFVQGTIHFTGTDADNFDGGALYLQSFGQLQLNKGSHLTFENNLGKYVCCFVSVCDLWKSSEVFIHNY